MATAVGRTDPGGTHLCEHSERHGILPRGRTGGRGAIRAHDGVFFEMLVKFTVMFNSDSSVTLKNRHGE